MVHFRPLYGRHDGAQGVTHSLAEGAKVGDDQTWAQIEDGTLVSWDNLTEDAQNTLNNVGEFNEFDDFGSAVFPISDRGASDDFFPNMDNRFSIKIREAAQAAGISW